MTQEQKLEGRKADDGRAPMYQGLFQYFPDALQEVAMDSLYGKLKYNLSYDDVNWSRVPDGFNRYSDALPRHLGKEFSEGLWDLEAQDLGYNVLHATMVAWNALARLQLLIKELKEKGLYKEFKVKIE